ncbi:hypothetical protein EDC01DRAFT_631649 [Geopyxis carbonaria]|nr:hypothetical protein EDC01DRAFT_631649 [Geopyxis carbonaria]
MRSPNSETTPLLLSNPTHSGMSLPIPIESTFRRSQQTTPNINPTPGLGALASNERLPRRAYSDPQRRNSKDIYKSKVKNPNVEELPVIVESPRTTVRQTLNEGISSTGNWIAWSFSDKSNWPPCILNIIGKTNFTQSSSICEPVLTTEFSTPTIMRYQCSHKDTTTSRHCPSELSLPVLPGSSYSRQQSRETTISFDTTDASTTGQSFNYTQHTGSGSEDSFPSGWSIFWTNLRQRMSFLKGKCCL